MVLSKLRKALQRRGSNQQEQKQQAKKKMPRRASTGSIDNNTWFDVYRFCKGKFLKHISF